MLNSNFKACSDKPATTAGSRKPIPRRQYAHIWRQQTQRGRYRSSREQNQSRVRFSLLLLVSTCSYTCIWASIDKKSKFSRKRPNEDEGDITYINEHNRVFNKKVCHLLVFHSPPSLRVSFYTDCTILRQVHGRDPGKFRTWYCSVIMPSHRSARVLEASCILFRVLLNY
jgi:SYF2 splicing factor